MTEQIAALQQQENQYFLQRAEELVTRYPTEPLYHFDLGLIYYQFQRYDDAIRLAPELEELTKESLATPKRTGLMVDAEGRRGEPQVWGHRAKWVDYFGEIDGEKLGIAILDHPSNPRHPTYWHSRSYGLFAANIFGLHDFDPKANKKGAGDFVIEPDKTATFRYRIVIHTGDAKAAKLDEKFREYAGEVAGAN